MKTKRIQIYLTEAELASVREAAKSADVTPSDFGRKILLRAALNGRKPDDSEALTAVQNFRRLFVEAMELSLTGKLTAARLRGLAERLS